MGAVSHENHKSHRREYFRVFFVLAALTVVELIIPGMASISHVAKTSSLILLALGKASVVGWYYMHLKDETNWLRFIALIPISAFCYAVMVILESLYR